MLLLQQLAAGSAPDILWTPAPVIRRLCHAAVLFSSFTMRRTVLPVRSIVLFGTAVQCVRGHGFMITPAPRNAIDKDLPQFADGHFPQTNGDPGCNQSMQVCGCWCDNGTSTCEVGQRYGPATLVFEPTRSATLWLLTVFVCSTL